MDLLGGGGGGKWICAGNVSLECADFDHSLFQEMLNYRTSSPHRLVVRTSRRGRDNPGSTPGEDIFILSV